MSYWCEFSSAVREGNVEKVQFLLTSYPELSDLPAWSSGNILLKDALENGHVTVAKLLLDAGARINKKSGHPTDTDTLLLHYAAEWGFKDIVERLLTKGARVNAANKSDTTPLHCAARKDNDGIVKLLLEHGALVNASTRYGITPLHISVQHGNVPITQSLLNHGASVFCTIEDYYDKYRTPLHTAADKGFEEICKLLLSKGASVNALSVRNGTPLHVAIQKGHINLVKLFLRYEVDTKATNYNGDTCLHVAAREGSEDVVNALLASGFSVDVTSEGVTPAFLALKRRHTNIVRLLLEKGADVNFQDKNGNTILCTAVEKSESFVDLVLNFSPDVNNEDNQRALKIAALQEGDTSSGKIIERLLQYGFKANLKVNDAKDVKVLHTAVEKGYFQLVEVMLKSSQDVVALMNARGSNGRTSLHLAVEKARSDFVNLLIRFGADVNVQDNNGNTILCIAVKNLYQTFVDMILTFSPDVNNEQNECALKIAALQYGDNAVVVERLLQYGFKAHLKVDDAKDIEVLHAAVAKGYFKLVEEMLESCENVDSLVNARGSIGDTKGLTSLHVASKNGQQEMVTLLIRFGADVNARTTNNVPSNFFTEEEKTPLFYSVEKRYTNISKILLSNKAEGSGCLWIALKRKNPELLELLLQHGADPNTTGTFKSYLMEITPFFRPNRILNDRASRFYYQRMLYKCGVDVEKEEGAGDSVLAAAIVYDDPELVQILLEYGANVNDAAGMITDGRGPALRTPLMVAAATGNVDITTMLLDKGAALNVALMPKEVTALHMAAYFGHKTLVDFLLKQPNIEFEFKDCEQRTPLHYAAETDADVASALLRRGASVNSKDCFGKTPLHYAAEISTETVPFSTFKDEDIAEVLLRFGAKPNAKDVKQGYNALHYWAANRKSQKSILSSILKYGTDIDSKSSCGKTPLYVAVENGCISNVSVLLRYGADINIMHVVNKDLSNQTTPLQCAEENHFKKHAEVTSPHDVSRQASEYARKVAEERVRDFEREEEWYPYKSYEDYEKYVMDGDEEPLYNVEYKLDSQFLYRCHSDTVPTKFFKIADIIRRHTIMLDCANFFVNDRDLKSVDYCDDVKMNEYRRKCQEELSLFKRTKFSGSPEISFYDFLTKSSNKLATLFEKENIAEIMSSAEFRYNLRSLVIYRDLIDYRLNMALKRGNLLRSATECFVKVFSLPDLCADAITDFLRNIDLDNFVKACKQSNAKCSSDSVK